MSAPLPYSSATCVCHFPAWVSRNNSTTHPDTRCANCGGVSLERAITGRVSA